MDNQALKISFEGASPAEANRYASELRDYLQRLTSDLNIEFSKDKPNTQDFGTSLVIILGTPAVIAISKGIADWLRKRNSATISIKTSTGTEIKGSGLSSADIQNILLKGLSKDL